VAVSADDAHGGPRQSGQAAFPCPECNSAAVNWSENDSGIRFECDSCGHSGKWGTARDDHY